MSRFVKAERIPVTDGTDTIYIRGKMDYGTTQRVRGSIFALAGDLDNPTGKLNLGEANIALLVHNIVAWEGPGFTDDATGKPIPVTPQNIETLPADDPLIDAVLAKIAELNPRRATDPKDSTSTGVSGSTASVSEDLLVTTISTSP
jgi:hypothetical protein